MKKIFLIAAALLAIMSLVFFSCSSNENEPSIPESVGVHKIVFEITGDKDVNYTLSFAGTSGTGMAALYDANNNYMEETWLFPGNAEENQRIICHTDAGSSFLTCAVTISALEINTAATYKIKAYVNEKLVKEISKEVKFTNLSQVEIFSISTTTLPD